MKSDIIKQHIVDYIKNNPRCIKTQFDPSDPINELDVQDVNVWKRESKEKLDNSIVRTFLSKCPSSALDCLQVEVFTDINDSNIISIVFTA